MLVVGGIIEDDPFPIAEGLCFDTIVCSMYFLIRIVASSEDGKEGSYVLSREEIILDVGFVDFFGEIIEICDGNPFMFDSIVYEVIEACTICAEDIIFFAV